MAGDNTPRFWSPTTSDNSPQPGLVPQSGNIVSKSTNLSQNKGKSMNPSSHRSTGPEVLQKVPSYAEYTRMALSSSGFLGVTGPYSDAASNQPSRATNPPRLADYPPTADPTAASTSREWTSKNRTDISRSRSGQVSPHYREVLVCDPHQELILRSSPLLA